MIYIVHETGSPFYKIGYTSRYPSQRVRDLQTGNPRKLRLVASIGGARGTWRMEQYIHGRLDKCRVGRYTREWYDVSRQEDAVKIIMDTFDINLKATYDPETFAKYAQQQYVNLKKINDQAIKKKDLRDVYKTNGEPADLSILKSVDEWSKGKDRIILMSRGFNMRQFLHGEPFDRHQDDALSVASLLLSQGFNRSDAIFCVFHIQTLIAQGNPRMKKIWSIGKDFIHTSVDNADEIRSLCVKARKDQLV